MTIEEAITALDAAKPNTFPESVKVRWLSELDARLYETVLKNYLGAPESFAGYQAATDRLTQLLAPQPYDRMYLFWMEAQIDYWLGETTRYNNAIATFTAEEQAFIDFWHRTHEHRRAAVKWY